MGEGGEVECIIPQFHLIMGQNRYYLLLAPQEKGLSLSIHDQRDQKQWRPEVKSHSARTRTPR